MIPGATPTVRSSAIAGRWYPGTPTALRHAISTYLDAVDPHAIRPLPGRILALIAPHAGYSYSGPTAARAFAQLREAVGGGQAVSRVILFGPLHRPIRGSRLGPFMTVAENAYRTPLGDVPVDHAFLGRVAESVPLVTVRGDEEHSLEIELPFLQSVLPGGFTMAPVMFGEHIADPGVDGRLERFAEAVSGAWDDRTLLVVSTDLTHDDNYARVVRADRIFAERLAAFDVAGLAAALQSGAAQACGATGLVCALKVARRLGAAGVAVLHQTTSGDVTGDKTPGAYTVGYLAAAVYGGV